MSSLTLMFLASSKGSGLTFNFARLALALKNSGLKVIVVSGQEEQQKGLLQGLISQGLTCYRLENIDNLSLRGTTSSICKIGKIIKQYNVDLIHAQGIRHMLVAFAASKVSLRKRKAKIAVSIHSTLHGRYLEKLALILISFLLNIFSDVAMPVAKRVTDKLIKLGLLPSKAVTVYNGIDLKHFDDTQRDSNLVHPLPSSFMSSSDTLIGYSANMFPHKGHKYLVLAVSVLLKEFPNIRLVLTSDGPMKNELKTLTEKLGIAQNVFFTGRIEYKSLYKLLQKLSIYAFPSLAELFPFAVIEAMASGKPIVATDVGGVSEMILNGENGILIPSGNVGHLVKALKTLIIDKSKAELMGIKSRKTVEERFDLLRVVDDLTKCYNTCMRSTMRA